MISYTYLLCFPNQISMRGGTLSKHIKRVPALHAFWDLEKTVLHETRVSGTVMWSPTHTNFPTYTYISQKSVSGNRVSDFRVSGGPPVIKMMAQVR